MLPLSNTSFKSLAKSYCRREDGSFIILSLCLFIVMIMFTGLALDLMNHHTRHTRVQSTMDRASLAAASLDQTLDPEEVVKEYFAKAGLENFVLDIDVQEKYVGTTKDSSELTAEEKEQLELVSRTVSVQTQLDTPTYIMHMMGTPVLESPVAGQAMESIQNVEISLVLDVSGSMGSNNRLTNLKSATTEFIETVIDEERTEGITTMSIIPYNGYVVAPDVLLDELNADPENVQLVIDENDKQDIEDQIGLVIDAPNVHEVFKRGMIRNYPDSHSLSNCIRFRREGGLVTDRNDFTSTAITTTQRLERVAHFDEGGSSGYGFDKYVPDTKSWCPGDNDAEKTRSQIMLPSADISDLTSKINGLSANGWTGIDNGVKWGAALLDPAFRPVIANLITDGVIPAKLENRPNDYDEIETIKIIVVMTDGANTLQRDIKDKYKTGPSRIWYSQNVADASGRWYDGYFVHMPENSSSRRWFQPRKPGDTGDGRYFSEADLPDIKDWGSYTGSNSGKRDTALKQMDYVWLYSRFSEDDLAKFFFQQQDSTAYNAHRKAVYDYSRYSDTDTRLSDICAAAKKNAGLIIYSIAFEAPAAGQAAMKDCATNVVDTYYQVSSSNTVTDGGSTATSIQDAFRSIAGKISQLRLTQ